MGLKDAFARDMERLEKAATYDKPWSDRERLCPCCGNGFPVCADFETLSRELAHRLTCQQYRFDHETCEGCTYRLADPA